MAESSEQEADVTVGTQPAEFGIDFGDFAANVHSGHLPAVL